MDWVTILNTVVYVVIIPALVIVLGSVGFKVGTLTKEWLIERQLVLHAETVVLAVEQLYKNLDGPAKYEQALARLTRRLNNKGLSVDQDAIEELIEAAVKGMKLGYESNEPMDDDVDFDGTDMSLGSK